MTNANKSPVAEIQARCVTPNRTWSLVHVETGMQVGLITGKRRLRAVLASLEGVEAGSWQEWAGHVTAWRKANPRGVAA